jgi:hypothetical protein
MRRMDKRLRQLLKNDLFQAVLIIIIVVVAFLSVDAVSRYVLNCTISPALTVISGSMCISQNGDCDGFSHVFDGTLHIGDVLIIQNVDAHTLNADYPNSDIIIFQRPDVSTDDTYAKVVHRIVSKIEVNGTLYFYTKVLICFPSKLYFLQKKKHIVPLFLLF